MMNSIPDSIDKIIPYDELTPEDKQTIN